MEAPTKRRFVALSLISGAVVINYLDRATIGVASPSIAHDFHLGPLAMGVVFSAFSWSYFLAQVPAGILLDRIGARLIYFFAILGWSLSTLLHALARGFGSLLGLRLALGFFEAPCFPANSSIVAAWFPRRERALAIGVYTSAEYVALGFASPLLFWIAATYGWRTLFLVSGGLGLLFTLVWRRFYVEPSQDKRVNAAELALIREGNAHVSTGGQRPFSWHLLRQLICNRRILGLCIGQISVYSTFTFFLTWFPTYLAQERHMGWIKVGFFASLPYLAGFFGILFAGWGSDTLLRKGASLNVARKTPVIAGLIFAGTIVAANYVQNNVLVIAILSLAFFAQAMSSSGWAVISEVAPPGTLGLIGGLFSGGANLGGIITPLAVGAIYQATGSFFWALVFVGGVAVVGALSWIFLVGDIAPVHLSPNPERAA